jgi:hypothetical protein
MNRSIASLRSPLLGSALLLLGAACWLAPAPLESFIAPGPTRTAASVSSEQRGDPATKEATSVEARIEEPRAAEPPLLDTWSLAVREDGAACRAELTAAGFKFQAFGDKTHVDKSGCGIPHPVLVFRGPTGIVYDPPITVDCTLARALGSVERIVQEEASTHLRSPVVRIGNLGGYACRPRNYRKESSLSAHAFGSAVDIASFHPAKGTPAIVVRDYAEPKRATPAQDDRRRFLHGVFARLRREADLTYAVGPDFNAIHHNHFHLDRGGWHFWFNR